jgi:hypothetical protein
MHCRTAAILAAWAVVTACAGGTETGTGGIGGGGAGNPGTGGGSGSSGAAGVAGGGGGTTGADGGTPGTAGGAAGAAGGAAGAAAGASGRGGAAGGIAGAGGSAAGASGRGGGGGGAGGAGGRGGGTAGAGNTGGTGGRGGAAGSGAGGTGTGGAAGPVVAFPGAEGYGRNAKGGRGGDVCHVTTLADSGTGSLRDCVSAGNRTVVFDVGGWITLSSNLGIAQANITIAGQTAPGGGIGIRGRKVSIGGNNAVIRFLRIRRGIMVTTDRDDAMTISSSADNIIVDHCSVSFGTDETLSMPGDEGIGPHNLTLQWSIVAWGLQRNNHSAGSLFTSNQTTIHHTLWAFNKTRNPRARSELPETRGMGGPLDWVNNVIYGWNARDPVGESMGWSLSYDPFILAGTSNGQHQANAVGNSFIGARSASYAFHDGTSNFSLYVADNILDGNANGTFDVSRSGNDMIQGSPTILAQRLPAPMVATDPARTAYDRVLARAGATAPMRDQADTLLVSQVRAQTGILIQSEQDLVSLGVGDSGYGTLAAATRPTGFDTDRDGMPDAWETAQGLNPNDAADRNGDADRDGYTNLEEYLSSLVP